MPILIPNVLFDTRRAVFDPQTGVTSAATAFLYRQPGHMKHIGTSQFHAINYTFLPEGALRSDFILCVDDSMDIVLYDEVFNLTLLDNVTLWPTRQNPATGVNEFWRVEYVHNTPPGVLVHVECYVARVTGGGVPS